MLKTGDSPLRPATQRRVALYASSPAGRWRFTGAGYNGRKPDRCIMAFEFARNEFAGIQDFLPSCFEVLRLQLRFWRDCA